MVDNERHVTLTGWDRSDYDVLNTMRDVSVLQMANPDVTDQTLDLLKEMNQLIELDLNYTKVTDAGLATLRGLPALAILRLKATAVTDEGFRAHLLDKESLLELDLRETQVTSKTLREWKAKNSDKRKYLK
jgi:hypothetical protein